MRAVVARPFLLAAAAVLSCGSVDESPAPSARGSIPYFRQPQCEPDMICFPDSPAHAMVAQREAWEQSGALRTCPSGSEALQYGIDPALDSSCAPCKCGSPKGDCNNHVFTYKDDACASRVGDEGFKDDGICHALPARSSVPLWMRAVAEGRNLVCDPTPAKLVPEAPYGGQLSGCSVGGSVRCYRGTSLSPEYCYPRPSPAAGRFCRVAPGDVCPPQVPEKVVTYPRTSSLAVDFRECTRCACKATGLACERGETALFCDSTCSGTGPCTTPKLVLGDACTEVTEVVGQPFSWRETPTTVRGACEPVQSVYRLKRVPDSLTYCCEPL